MPWLIYTLRDPREKLPYYVGVTCKKPHSRLYAHLSEARNSKKRSHRLNWILSLLDAGYAPIMEVVEDVKEGDCWKAREIAWIARYRAAGYPLCNMTDGGEGSLGLIKSHETRLKLSRAAKGRVLSDVTRMRMSQARKGRKLSPSHIQKIRDRPPASDATRRKISDSLKGHIVTKETREKLRERNLGRWAGIPLSPEHVRKIRDSNRGKRRSSEVRQRQREEQIRRMSNPEIRRRISERLKGRIVPPAILAKRVAAQTGLKRSEETRQRMRIAARARVARQRALG